MKTYSKLKKRSIYVFVINYFILEEHVKAQNIEIIITTYCYLKPNWGQSHFKVMFQFLLTATLSSTFNTEFIFKMSREVKGLKKCDSIKTLAPL